MQMDIDNITILKKTLREDLARFSTPLQRLMEKYDPKYAPPRDRALYGAFQEDLGHTAKDMAYAYARIDALVREEPNITEAEIIQETLRKYCQFGNAFQDVARRHGFDLRELEPLTQVIGDSVSHCRAALEEAGGPRLRRTFKFALGDLLGNENILLAEAHHYISKHPAERQVQLALFRERILPEMDKMYRLADYVGSGKLDFEDATKLLTRMQESLGTMASQTSEYGVLEEPLAPIQRKVQAALQMCADYAREDYRGKGTGR